MPPTLPPTTDTPPSKVIDVTSLIFLAKRCYIDHFQRQPVGGLGGGGGGGGLAGGLYESGQQVCLALAAFFVEVHHVAGFEVGELDPAA
jgi:hypothetical protein